LTTLHDGCLTAEIRSNSVRLCRPFKQHSADGTKHSVAYNAIRTFYMHRKGIWTNRVMATDTSQRTQPHSFQTDTPEP